MNKDNSNNSYKNSYNHNDYKFNNIYDVITSLISFIILMITQVLDTIINFIIHYVYVSSISSSSPSPPSSSSSLSLISSISILLLSLMESLIYRYNYLIDMIIYIINSIVIIINKIRIMIIINENDNNDNFLQSLANDAKIKIDTHNITTIDGYILGLHRCSKITNDNNNNDNIIHNAKNSSYFDPLLHTPPSSPSSTPKLPVVLLLHGLLQSSDTFIADGKQSLASILVNKGYDVWLGNSRGNKYSDQHINYNQYDHHFWNFCLDDYANYDVPAIILYIRNLTSSSSSLNDKISVIGFSQGSAEVFASLSMHPSLNQYINIFIAIAPPIKPVGLNKNILSTLIHRYPNITNIILGYKSCFPYMPILKKILGYPVYVETCTNALKYLFGWNCSCISKKRRYKLFKTIFSGSSVKCIKHWFQMIEIEELNTYQDTIENEIYNQNLEYNNINDIILNEKDNIKIIKKLSQYKKSIPKKLNYNMNNIECKVAVIAGDSDKLIDPYVVKKKIKNHQITYIIKNYEHLDLIWADDAYVQVFPKILKLLEKNI